HNYRILRDYVAPAQIMPVVKANAYGHGLVPCAKRLEKEGAPYFGVAFLEEGVELRKAGITKPVLVFGGIFNAQIKHFLAYDLDLTASSVEKLQAIDGAAKALGKKARVQLKVDTGMGRIGMRHDTAHALFEA